MGCLKGSSVVLEYINYLQHLASTDYTEASKFTAEDNQWLKAKVADGTMGQLGPKELGVQDANGKTITIERLMDPSYIEFTQGCLGIDFPQEELLNRNEYGWFNMLSPLEATLSNTSLGKLLLVSLPMNR